MKDTSDPDQDPGGPVPLAQKSLSDVTGVGLGSHLRGSQLGGSQVSDPSNYMWSHLGLPGANLHPPFHMAALTSHVYSPSFLGHNFTPSALIASLSGRGDHVTRGRPPIPPPLIPPSGGTPTLANLHATLAAGDASRHAELLALLKDSARQHELLFSLSKLAASGPSSSASSCLSSSSSSTSSSSSSFHLPSHQNSPPPKHPHETSPPEKQSLRASSLSPSSYMTPRSLNGSPSAPFAGATPNLGSRMFPVNSLTTLENLSPTSPPTGGEGLNNNSSSGSTPTRKSSTPRPDRVFTCKICSRSFGYKHVLQNHERTHTGEKPFECKECHKRFTRDHHLKTHMRLHTGEKPYHCTHCDRQFVQVANLRRHLRVHTGERPYSCEMCSSKFSDSNQLKAHLLIHKGEKPFECVRCLGKFRRRHHLIYHKCSKDPDAEKGFRDSLSLGNSSFPDGENFGYVETIFPNEEIDDEDLLDEETTSPTPTTTLTTTTDEEHLHSEKRRERKSKEPRRLVPNPPSSMLSPTSDDVLMSPHLPPTPLPEQTEPEDLSMNGSRRSTHRTYRANIALTTSSEYPRYPLQYPSSLEGHPSVDDGQVMVDGYETNNPETLSPNL